MSGHSSPWTEDDMATLQREWRDGKTVREIAEPMGRSPYAVYAKIKRLPFTTRRAHEARIRPEMIARRFEQLLGKAWAPDENLMRDDEYVARCMAQGGFVAFSERTGPRGYAACCLPIIRPVFA